MQPRTLLIIALAAPVVARAQDIPTPGHKCVYNCDAPTTSSAPSGYGAAMGAALGAAIVRSIANQQQQNQAGPTPDNGQSAAAQRALDNWASGGSGQAGYTTRPAPVYRTNSAESQLDQWANQVRSEDLRDAPNSNLKNNSKPKPAQNSQAQLQISTQPAVAPSPATVPSECKESGQTFDDKGRPIGHFYQCWPNNGDKYCLQTAANGGLDGVPCNTASR